MITTNVSAHAASGGAYRVPAWMRAAAGLGLLWNAFGAYQFMQSITATEASLVAMGMTVSQAQLMAGYPAWMSIAFAIGTFGGLVGTALMLASRAAAVPVFVASLAGYVILYVGDITEGVFAALGAPQVAILTLVVLIAAALLWLSLHMRRRELLH